VDGQAPHLYYFRTPETLDELRGDLWRFPPSAATRPQTHFIGSVPLQVNMFTGEWEDNRTDRQKQLDRERGQLKQQEMFSQREIAQFGVNAHPLLPLSPHTKLSLMFEDHRTEEELERDRQRQAEKKTYQLFQEAPALEDQPSPAAEVKPQAVVVYEAPCLALIELEAANRAVIPWTEARRYDPPIRRQTAPTYPAA
jgi:hypothetical protein